MTMLVAVWAAILSGFVYNNLKKYFAGQLTYPWVVHIHAAFFVGWLLLFTAQIALVRRGDLATHRRLGALGMWLAPVMVILGVSTAIVTERLKFGTLVSDPRFLSVMFADMLIFGGLVVAAMRMRNQTAAHKRLMLIATLVITDAGFGRWLSPMIGQWTGQTNYWEFQKLSAGAWPFIRFQFLPAYTLIALVGAFDLVTRRRFHPAYVRALEWCVPVHLLALWLYYQPFWQSIAVHIIGLA